MKHKRYFFLASALLINYSVTAVENKKRQNKKSWSFYWEYTLLLEAMLYINKTYHCGSE